MSDEKIPTFEQMRDRYVELRGAKDHRIEQLVADVAAEWIAALERYLLTAYTGSEPHPATTAYARNLQHEPLDEDYDPHPGQH